MQREREKRVDQTETLSLRETEMKQSETHRLRET